MNKKPDFFESKESGERVFVGNFISVERDIIRLPDGNMASREVVRHPGAAVILPLLDEQTILFEWQYRYPIARHTLEIPAGKLEEGEQALETAKRELLEETGYQAKCWKPLTSIHTCVGFCDEKLDIFQAEDLVYVGHSRETGENIEIYPIALQKAMEMVRNGEITDAKTIISLFILNNC